MTSYIRHAKVYGASIIGKSHVACSICNQDAYLIKKTKFGIMMCVCDGVGSHKYSQHGAKAACKAAATVFTMYSKRKIAKKEIGKHIEILFGKYLKKKYRNEAATTCLFVYVYKNHEVVIGQAGDGIILIKINGRFTVFQKKTDDFMNEVHPIDGIHPYLYWKIRNLEVDANSVKELTFLLSTDGISEDILPNKLEQFMDYFVALSKDEKNNRGLRTELANWSVPGSIDDKTVITFSWKEGTS